MFALNLANSETRHVVSHTHCHDSTTAMTSWALIFETESGAGVAGRSPGFGPGQCIEFSGGFLSSPVQCMPMIIGSHSQVSMASKKALSMLQGGWNGNFGRSKEFRVLQRHRLRGRNRCRDHGLQRVGTVPHSIKFGAWKSMSEGLSLHAPACRSQVHKEKHGN
jgi:hypothetical protein